MSLLLLDVGNTRLKWARWDGEYQESGAVVHRDQPWALLALMLPTQLHARPAAVWLACVPRLRQPPLWQAAVEQTFNIQPQIVLAQAQWQGLSNAYAEPEKLGVDRWLAMLALWQELRGPFCVAAAGTALTFDRVAALGQHLGGVIAPGLVSAQHSLLNVTVTTAAAGADYHQDLGRYSVEAIRQGSFFAACGVIEHSLRAPGADVAEKRFLTGGDADALIPHLGPGWQLRHNLVLDGLLALARNSP